MNCACALTSEGEGVCFDKHGVNCEDEGKNKSCDLTGGSDGCPPFTVCVPSACCARNSTEADTRGRCVKTDGCGKSGGGGLGRTLLFERIDERMVEWGAL